MGRAECFRKCSGEYSCETPITPLLPSHRYRRSNDWNAPVPSLRELCAKCIFVKISLPRSFTQPNINRFASAPLDAPLSPSLKGKPHRRIGPKWLYTAPGHVDERDRKSVV